MGGIAGGVGFQGFYATMGFGDDRIPLVFDYKDQRYLLYNGNNFGRIGFDLTALG